MAELVDATDLKSVESNLVRVQVPPRPPLWFAMLKIARTSLCVNAEDLKGLFSSKNIRHAAVGPGYGTLVRAKMVQDYLTDGAFSAVYFDCRVPCGDTPTATWTEAFACISKLGEETGLYVPAVIDPSVPRYINANPELAVIEFLELVSGQSV